jgi:hypothetical protein
MFSSALIPRINDHKSFEDGKSADRKDPYIRDIRKKASQRRKTKRADFRTKWNVFLIGGGSFWRKKSPNFKIIDLNKDVMFC